MIKHFFDIYSILSAKKKLILFFIAFLGIINTFFESVGLALIIPILYSFEITDNSPDLIENSFLSPFFSLMPQDIYHLIFIFFSIFLIKNLFFLYSVYLKNNLKNKIIEYNSKKIIESFQSLQFDEIATQKIHKIERNIRKGLVDMIEVVLFETVSIFIDLTLFISFLFFLILINPAPILLSLVLLTSIAFFYKKIIISKIKILGGETASLSANQLKILMNIFMGYKELRIFNKMDNFRKNFSINLRRFHKINLIYSLFSSFPRLIFELIPIVVILILIYYLKEISKIPLNEAIVILATFSFAVIRMTPYISRFLTSFQRINYSFKFSTYAFQQIQNFMNINSNFNKEIIKSFENLIFEDLKFQYKTGREIIDIKKFEIKKGDVIGIFGRSGSGKSTLAEIILGYISPSSGTLKINLGKKLDLSHKKIEIDKSFYLPQNVFIFDENIFSNISMDIELKNMNEKKFKKIFDLTNLIEFSEQKKDMKLGENGKEISGGERQRIGFARCLYNNWDFIILDEATSAMDKYNEKSILEKVIKNKEKTQTILMISHNKNLLKEFCSEVYEFKEKKLVKTENGQR